jgi:hypothetical protein
MYRNYRSSHGDYFDEPTKEHFNSQWENRRIFCYNGDWDGMFAKWIDITEDPPKECPYYLEQVINVRNRTVKN